MKRLSTAILYSKGGGLMTSHNISFLGEIFGIYYIYFFFTHTAAKSAEATMLISGSTPATTANELPNALSTAAHQNKSPHRAGRNNSPPTPAPYLS